MWKTFWQSTVLSLAWKRFVLGSNRFSRHFADCIRKDRPKPNDNWHIDEAVITVGGKKFWLWRAIDADGDVLDILGQTRRNITAARRFFSRSVRQLGEPGVVVADKLRSYTKPIQTWRQMLTIGPRRA